MTDQQTVPTPAASLPVLPASGSRLLAVALLAVAALGVGRFALKLLGIAALGGVVLATVAALTGGILVLRAMLGQ
ncbi:MAG TPA: hypothetical protein VGO26_03985 [Amnibacterium sp.]|nr:hypothetical protein [Amnibacterium sp.]